MNSPILFCNRANAIIAKVRGRTSFAFNKLHGNRVRSSVQLNRQFCAFPLRCLGRWVGAVPIGFALRIADLNMRLLCGLRLCITALCMIMLCNMQLCNLLLCITALCMVALRVGRFYSLLCALLYRLAFLRLAPLGASAPNPDEGSSPSTSPRG